MSMLTKKIARISILITVAIILGYIENAINIIPVSGIKLGLSNFVLLYCIYKCSISETYLVVIIKSVLIGFCFSGFMSILYSVSGVICSATVMLFVYKYVKNITIYGISMLGSCVFNIVQFCVASCILGNFMVLFNLWYVLPLSLGTGLILAEIFRFVLLKEN